ncbi:hypothetical protein QQF64_033809 [Cirrhinus molitorella]|uniref:Uncharacterized protein n=1 Tax=Cirrhinus molitorella TaxID=172907 RepID=A0ABR3MV15_9TELE
MKETIDTLLKKHHGKKDMLKLVDQEYAAMVHSSCTDPNSMLHSTTRLHISQYVRHLAKLLNTSSSLNTSQEKLVETQQLWYSLTEGSDTTSVPVTTVTPAVMLPPAPPPTTPMTHMAVEKIVEEIMERQQQQLQQQQQQQPTEQKKKQTKTCLACGQPKSRYENDGSSIHFFYQQGPVRYFYCSTKVFTTYSAEGLTNQRMPFQDFMETEFFQREPEATKKRVEEKGQQKRKRSDTQPQPTGRLCRFCKMELKKGPNSPHVHTGFPGVSGKYIYCPAKVFFIYKDQGMDKELTWKDFKDSAFYEAEKQRWIAEKGK